MRFEFIIFIAATILSCSSRESRHEDNYVEVNLGDAPRLNASPLTTTAVTGDTVIFLDPSAKAAHRFGISPFRLESSVPFEDTYATGGILAGQDGRYLIGLSGADIAIQGEAGYQFNPVVLPGHKIASAAFDPKANIVALSDDYEAIAMVALTADGAVLGSWLGGPILGNDGAVGNGGFISGGRFLAALGAGSFALIDAAASIKAQGWQYKLLNVEGLDKVDFVTPLPQADQFVMIGSSGKIQILNIDTGVVQSSLSLPENVSVRSSTLGKPHVIYALADESVQLKVAYPDAQGNFIEKSLKSRMATGDLTRINIIQSHLDEARGVLSLVVTQARRTIGTTQVRTILRYRLADSLLTDLSELPEGGDVAMAQDFYLIRYPSALGFVEKRSYGRSPTVERLEKFNLPFIME